MSGKTTTTIRMDRDLLKRLKTYAVKNSLFISTVISVAIKEYLDKKEGIKNDK